MLYNYLKSFIRNSRKGFVLIFFNLTGYSFSISILFLLGLFCHHELNYDTHLDGHNNIFRVELNRSYLNGDTSKLGPIAPGVHTALSEDVKGITSVSRMYKKPSTTVEVDGNFFTEEKIIFADSSFFTCFPINVLQSAGHEILTGNSVVVTRQLASRYFGDDDPIGKFVKVDSQLKRISAVVEDIPSNTHFDFEMVMLIEAEQFAWPLDLWMYPYSFYTYVTIPDMISPIEVERELNSYVYEYAKNSYATMGVSFDEWLANGNGMSYELRPIKEIHLSQGVSKEFLPPGNMIMIATLLSIAVIVWVLAWSNLASVIHAKNLTRKLEFGIRKIFALSNSSLTSQLLLEGLLVSLITTCVSIGLLLFLLPWYNDTISVHLEKEYILSNIWVFAIVHLAVGSFSGLRASLRMVVQKPLDLIQGSLVAQGSKKQLAQLFVNGQFVIASALVTMTLIMTSQLQYMIGKEAGYDDEGLISIAGLSRIKESRNLKSRLLSEAGISGVSFISENLGEVSVTGNLYDKDDPEQEMRGVNLMSVDRDFIDLVKLNLLQGRSFEFLNTNDTVNSIVVNESLVELYGWEEPVGKVLTPGGDWEGFRVIGVVEDFHFQPTNEEISPLGILYSYPQKDIAVIKVRDQSDVEAVHNLWSQYNGGQPAEIRYVEAISKDLYQNEEKLINSSRTFTMMAIILSLIGLFGFASHLMQRKTREIAIRKVSGASSRELFQYFQRRFLVRVLASWIISIPISVLAINKWLAGFPYVHNVRYVEVLLITLFSLALVSVLSVGRTVYLASVRNPVDVLRAT